MGIEGSWVGSSPRRMRLRLEYSVSPGVSDATVTADLYIDAQYSISDRNNSLSWSGTFGSGVSSQTITPRSGGSQRLKAFSKVVPLTSSAQSLPFSASLSGIEYVGATATVSGYIPIPAKAVNPPNAPTNATLNRADDGSYTLTWDYSGPAADSFVIDAAYRVGDWFRVYTASGSLRQVRGFGFRANDAVVLRIAASNAAGTSAVAYSPYRRTVPAAPASVTVDRLSATSVRVGWQNRHQYGDSNEIWYRVSDNGGATWGVWVLAANNLAANAVSHTINLPESTRSYQIAVQTRIVSEVDWPLTALSAPSRVLGPIVPPHAPEITAPSGTVNRSTGSTLAIRWVPRHIDGTAQSAAEIQVRKADGTGLTSYTVTGATSTRSITMPAAGEWEVRARTKGMHASYGEWSEWRRFLVTTPPVVTIGQPSSTVTAANITSGWSFSDPSGLGQASATVELLDADGIVWSGGASGNATTLAIPVSLVNHTSYTLHIQATSSSGLTSAWATRVFSTAFTPPPTPSVAATWEGGTGEVRVTVTNPPGAPPAVANAIERSADSVNWELVGVAAPGGELHDYSVPLGKPAWYRAVATTASGAVAPSASVLVDVPGEAVYLRTRTGQMLVLRHNLQLSAESGHETRMAQYLGRAHPTAHYGRGRPEKVSISGAVTDDETVDLDALLGGHVWFRDPTGRAWWAALDGSHSSTQSGSRWRSVSFSLVRIDMALDQTGGL